MKWHVAISPSVCSWYDSHEWRCRLMDIHGWSLTVKAR